MLINLRERNRSDGRMGYRDRDKRKERRKSGRLGELLSRKARRAQDKERKRRHLNHLYDGTCRSNMNAAQKMRWECAQSLREIMKSPGRGKKKRASEKRRERKKERKKEREQKQRARAFVGPAVVCVHCICCVRSVYDTTPGNRGHLFIYPRSRSSLLWRFIHPRPRPHTGAWPRAAKARTLYGYTLHSPLLWVLARAAYRLKLSSSSHRSPRQQ